MGDRRELTVKKLADLAGISVRTLHLYDELGLLKPSIRTEAGYRLYGERELLRLQQILFYKELDMPLQQIGDILDDPQFNMIEALQNHKNALNVRKERLNRLLGTIENTINKMKEGMSLTNEDLYDGFPEGKANEWRDKAIKDYGAQSVETSENYLKSLGKEGFAKLKLELEAVSTTLFEMKNRNATDDEVQRAIAKHYEIIRKFWGTYGSPDPQADAYAGLGDLYLADERFTQRNGKSDRDYAAFLNKAMKEFVKGLKR